MGDLTLYDGYLLGNCYSFVLMAEICDLNKFFTIVFLSIVALVMEKYMMEFMLGMRQHFTEL